MIYLDNVRDMDEKRWNYVITRRPKNIDFNKEKRLWVPELSPSKELLDRYKIGLNNEKRKNPLFNENKYFEEFYVSDFINEIVTNIINNTKTKERLNELYKDSFNKEIRLICFCSDEKSCHRSIIGGILLGAGAKVYCDPSYKKYYDIYKEKREMIRQQNQVHEDIER